MSAALVVAAIAGLVGGVVIGWYAALKHTRQLRTWIGKIPPGAEIVSMTTGQDYSNGNLTVSVDAVYPRTDYRNDAGEVNELAVAFACLLGLLLAPVLIAVLG